MKIWSLVQIYHNYSAKELFLELTIFFLIKAPQAHVVPMLELNIIDLTVDAQHEHHLDQ